MVEFAAYIEEKWGLSFEVAEEICSLYKSGNSKYFVSNYVPTVSACVDTDMLSEVYRFLDKQKELDSVREKAIAVLEKAEALDEDTREKIVYSISEAEIEDVYLAYRTNVRTKGRMAVEKGLDPLADRVDELEDMDLEAAAAEYVDPEKGLAAPEDVLKGVGDILAERYGFDEEARIMLREFAEDEGMVAVHFKKKAKKKFERYNEESICFSDLEDSELLELRRAEENGEIKVKVSLPPMHVMELLKEHFWDDSDAVHTPLIYEALDDAWARLLSPMVEKSVKEHYYEEAQKTIVSQIKNDLRASVEEYAKTAKSTILFISEFSEKVLEILVVDSTGSMLRCTQENIRQFGRPFVSKKIKQLFGIYHPSRVAILNNEYGEYLESVVEQTTKVTVSQPDIEMVPVTTKTSALVKSSYFEELTKGLAEETVKSLAYALAVMKPFSVISKVGAECFSLHPYEKIVGSAALGELIDDLYVAAALEYGINPGGGNDYLLNSLDVKQEQLDELRKAVRAHTVRGKADIRELESIDEVTFNNIAGYLVFPNSAEVLDKSTVHPQEFTLVHSVCDELGLSPEKLVRNISKIQEFTAEDKRVEDFIRKNIAEQLKVAKRYLSLSDRPKRKLRFSELSEGAVLEGRVTNITGFGAFVDINSYSDGLVHISELANDYVESPDQVVSAGDVVRVMVVEVNRRKKRISLSMKRVKDNANRVKPSRTQLEDLVNFFNN
ncbi:MAG: S1 RNA-binding domain-containing protein [Fibrobacterota bacterium]